MPIDSNLIHIPLEGSIWQGYTDVCFWDANERLATDTMMDKARTVTDTKTLQGEDLDKRNSYSAFISLN